jgi:hypothetical protein
MTDLPKRTCTILPDGSIEWSPPLESQTDGDLTIVVETGDSEPLPPQFVAVIHQLHARNQALEELLCRYEGSLPELINRRFDAVERLMNQRCEVRADRLKDGLKLAMAYWARHNPDDVYEEGDSENIERSWGDAVTRHNERARNKDVTMSGDWRECVKLLNT